MSDQEAAIGKLREEFASRAPARAGAACPPPDRIWAAVLGELEPDEARRLVDHSISCTTCSAAWRLARSLAGEAGSMDAAADAGSGRAGNVVQPMAHDAHRRRRIAWVALAASLVIVAGSAFLLMRRGPPSAWRELPITKPAYPLPLGGIVWRGGTAPDQGPSGVEDAFDAAMQPYVRGDLGEADRRLAAFNREHPDHLQGLFYRGVVLLLLDRSAEAIDRLTEARDAARRLAGSEALGAEAGWYRALALLEAGREEEAIEQLRSEEVATGAHQSDARRLLRQATRRLSGPEAP